MLHYNKILKQAFEITIKNKFLWIFGLFLSFVDALGMLLDRTSDISIPEYLNIILLVVSIAFWILYYRTRASLIIGIKAVLDNQETSAKKAFGSSMLFFVKLIVIFIQAGLALALIALVLWAPISFLLGRGMTHQAQILMVLAAIIFLPTVVVGMLVMALAPLFVIIFDQKTNEAIGQTFDLLSKHWLPLTGIFVILLLIQAPLFLLIFMVGLLGGWVPIIVSGIVFILIETIVYVFTQTVWVLSFLELVKPQKLAEEEPVIVPEIAG